MGKMGCFSEGDEDDAHRALVGSNVETFLIAQFAFANTGNYANSYPKAKKTT